jgi:hypothetical protein
VGHQLDAVARGLTADPPQLGTAVIELPLAFQSDPEGEDHHQEVVDPVLDGEAGGLGLPDSRLSRSERRVG